MKVITTSFSSSVISTTVLFVSSFGLFCPFAVHHGFFHDDLSAEDMVFCNVRIDHNENKSKVDVVGNLFRCVQAGYNCSTLAVNIVDMDLMNSWVMYDRSPHHNRYRLVQNLVSWSAFVWFLFLSDC